MGIINYSDFHFLECRSPSDYHIYLLADDKFTTPEDQLKSIRLGLCSSGRPPDNATAQGVDSVLSATDEELEEWLEENEETLDEGNKLCDPAAKTARRVMSLGKCGPRAYSNYSLFELAPVHTRSRDRPTEDRYLYLRGVGQRATRHSGFSERELVKIKELHDIWLVATSLRVNSSY